MQVQNYSPIVKDGPGEPGLVKHEFRNLFKYLRYLGKLLEAIDGGTVVTLSRLEERVPRAEAEMLNTSETSFVAGEVVGLLDGTMVKAVTAEEIGDVARGFAVALESSAPSERLDLANSGRVRVMVESGRMAMGRSEVLWLSASEPGRVTDVRPGASFYLQTIGVSLSAADPRDGRVWALFNPMEAWKE